MPSTIQVLLVEDNPTDALLLREALSEVTVPASFNLTHVSRLAEALDRLEDGDIQVVLLDLGLPDGQGLDTFHRLHIHYPDLPVIVLSGLDDETVAVQAVQAGAQDYLVKGQSDLGPMGRTIRYAIERRRLMSQVETLSVTDELTGLPNRRGLAIYAEQFMRLARRTSERLWLFMIDLDDFKLINDTHGHAAGDRALAQFARLLRSMMRDSDVVGRIGGDEFSAVVAGGGDLAPEAVRARLAEAVEQHNATSSEPFQLSFSLGAASYDPTQPITLDELMAKADEALYDCKRSRSKLG